MPAGRFPITKELRIGGLTKPQILERLDEHAVARNEYADALFADEGFTTASDVRDIRVALVSLPEIGLPEGGHYDQILQHASRAGLVPCPLEVAPHLRLSYLDQPEGPYLTVASLELRPGPETPNGMYLRNLDGVLWLRGYESGPENVYAPDFTDFVFIDPEADELTS